MLAGVPWSIIQYMAIAAVPFCCDLTANFVAIKPLKGTGAKNNLIENRVIRNQIQLDL